MSSWKNVSSSREPSLVWFMTSEVVWFSGQMIRPAQELIMGQQSERHQFLVNAGNVWGTNEHIHKCLFILNILCLRRILKYFQLFQRDFFLKSWWLPSTKAIYFRPNPKKIELKGLMVIIVIRPLTFIKFVLWVMYEVLHSYSHPVPLYISPILQMDKLTNVPTCIHQWSSGSGIQTSGSLDFLLLWVA